jgi:RNA polymerase sigma-70 factor (ECF subfamily)
VTDEEIYRKNKDDLIRYASVLVGPSEAEDVVSTVVLRILRRRPLDDLEEARAYLFRAVLNESRTRLSRRRTVSRIDDYHATPVSDPRPEVLEAVIGLPVRQRAATFLVYWSDLTVAEAARLMGTGPGTVKRYLYLAKRTLRGVLNDD